MTLPSGMATLTVLKELSIKVKNSLFNFVLTMTMYLILDKADIIARSDLYWSCSSPRAYLLQWLYLPIHPLRLYFISYSEWSPALTVSSICLSTLSMLSSATKKVKPFNDAEFVKRAAGRGPKAFLWSYDDDKA